MGGDRESEEKKRKGEGWNINAGWKSELRNCASPNLSLFESRLTEFTKDFF